MFSEHLAAWVPLLAGPAVPTEKSRASLDWQASSGTRIRDRIYEKVHLEDRRSRKARDCFTKGESMTPNSCKIAPSFACHISPGREHTDEDLP